VHHGLPSGGEKRGEKVMKKTFILAVVAMMVLGGCSGMSNTEQRVLSGGAIGAGSGALIGWAAGCPACGAAIGGAAGAAGGYVYDRYEKSQGRP
jgi:osmotically inducible lipoprotein OsmB